jgi:hypothetical protein
MVKLTVARKLDFFPGEFSQHGQTVLDTQPLDLAMPQLATIAYEFAPRRR